MLTAKFVWKSCQRGGGEAYLRQVPPALAQQTGIQFSFDPFLADYDWLVVYDEVPTAQGGRDPFPGHRIACPLEHTLLITVEPSSIKTYGRDFLNQFGVILTSHEPWAIDLPQVVRSQPALRWFYGASSGSYRTWEKMSVAPVPHKSGMLSTVCSAKRQKHTEHAARYDFTMFLRDRLPELELFGRGIRPINDKSEALDAFRYHIAIENHIAPHHWTEKLADVFLGHSLPFYHGCPNAADYFPADSFIPIDIHQPERALEIIRQAIDRGEYERRLPAIVEARRRVLEQYNLFAVVSQLIRKHHDEARIATGRSKLYPRHASRHRSLGHLVRFGIEQFQARRHHRRRAA